MVDIQPFQGIHPTAEKAEIVASPPYDVLNSDEARILAKNNKHSFLRVIKSEIDLPADPAPSKADIYKKAKANFELLVEEKVLIKDATPCFYIYQITMGNHVQTGLVAASSVDDYKNNRVKKHEFTRPDKEDDRANHVAYLGLNAGPVFLTYRYQDQIDDVVAEQKKAAPYCQFVAEDGVEHVLWIIKDQAVIENLQALFQAVPALYVADGHHRSAAAARVQDMYREKNDNHTGKEGYNYFLTVIFPDKELEILDYNRVVKDLNGFDKTAFIAKLDEKFEVISIEVADPEQAKPQEKHTFAMVIDNQWFQLKIKSEFIPQDDPIASLDAALLQEHLLNPILGIDNPRTNTRIDFVGGIRGLKELVRRCEVDSQVAFALYPTSIEELMAVADADKVMPPKSTWFEPKLRSGLVVREI